MAEVPIPMYLVRRHLACFIAFVCTTFSLLCAADDFEFFEKEIRPILTEQCYGCHSASAEKIKGGLRLDSKEAMLKGGDSGPAIVPRAPEKSLLIKAIRYSDSELQMPPKGKKLSAAQIEAFVEWVRTGAPDPRVAVAPPKSGGNYDFMAARTNWAFHPPKDPPLPAVKRQQWVKSPVDRFILARLEEKHLQPAQPADKRTLIRRATFDLTGVPPAESEIQEFLADKSPAAFSKVLDRLLSSPQYGERWGRHWLDVVRYADSADGRVTGGPEDFSEAWRYRDWVVNAFNRDLPYDQFIQLQIAGDIIATRERNKFDTNSIIATGMYAIGNWGNGDADKDKILTDIADDAVDVTGRAFLGLTLACARCHDHKFDPIPTADYYSLAGIFFSSHIIPKLSPKGSGETMLRIPLVSPEETERRKQRETRIAELEKNIETIQDEQVSIIASNALPQTARYLTAVWQWRQKREDIESFASQHQLDGAVLKRWIDFLNQSHGRLLAHSVRDVLGNKGLQQWRNQESDTPSAIANGSDLEASFLTIKLPAHRIAIHPSPKDAVAVAWKSPVQGAVTIKGRVVDVDPNCGDGIEWRVAKVSATKRQLLATGAIPSGGMEQILTTSPSMKVDVDVGDYVQLEILPKSGYECDTTMVELEISETSGKQRIWNLNQDVANDLLAGNPHADSFGTADIWHFLDLEHADLATTSSPAFALWIETATKPTVSLAQLKEVSERVQTELLRAKEATNAYTAFLSSRSAFWAPLRNSDNLFKADARSVLGRCKTELAELRRNPPPPIEMANGLQEGGVPESPHAGVHDVKIHIRGRYDRLGDSVSRRFPRLLAGDKQSQIKEGSGRLQLAEWIASKENPLTARVMVNRIWQHHFGEGIVRTPNNFGKLGTPPTHPELLDFLAHRFIESGWSIKALHRMIMLSATYQQSCIPDNATLKADPENKLFGRMNRRRLDAESLRDSILVAAEKLNLTLGGPSIRDFNTNRRTIYVMSVRSDRSNYRALFDAADPNSIVEQRAVSTVAPQALFLLNHPFVLEQTKALVQRVLGVTGNDEARIEWLYRNLYGRPAASAELKAGRNALRQARMVAKDENVVWAEYCQVLLCANEFTYID